MSDEPKAMPSAILAEKAILSCMLQNPSKFIGRAAAEGLDGHCFYLTKAIHTELIEFHKESPTDGEIELSVFITRLQMGGSLDRCGGASQIVDIYGAARTFAGWPSWSQQLRECKARRMTIEAAGRLATASDSDEAIQEVKSTLEALTKAVSGKLRAVKADIAAHRFLTNYNRPESKSDMPGEPTGIHELDAICGGLKPEEFYVIGGRPSRGKSVIMLQIACNFLMRGKAVAIFSLEMSEAVCLARLISCMGRISYGSITDPRTATDEDIDSINIEGERLGFMPLFIDATAGQRMDQIEAEAEAIRDSHGSLALVVVDYIQLIKGMRSKGESREQEIAGISGAMKQLAKKLGCPVLSASQLNENGQTRESRAIEQDADGLLMIGDEGIKAVKLRNAKRDEVIPLVLNGEFQRFERTYHQ